MENEIKQEIISWRKTLEEDMKKLGKIYDHYDLKVRATTVKLRIAERTLEKVTFEDEDFFQEEYIEKLEAELESAIENRQNAEDSFNTKYKYLNALVENINRQYPDNA